MKPDEIIIAVDAGNTNIKFAVYSNNEIIQTWTMSVCRERSPAEYFSILQSLSAAAGIDISAVAGVIVSSVVPYINPAITMLFKNFFGITPLFITGTSAGLFGINVRLAQHAIGTDRLADLVAARTIWPSRNLLVIGMGTVTVFNLLTKDGDLYGQVLAPGLTCIAQSMRTCTALLPEVCVCNDDMDTVVRNSTESAVQSGVYWGYKSMISGIVEQINLEEQDKSLYVVATGGGSNVLRDCNAIDHIDPSLTLRGILQIYLQLKKGPHH
ncbi:type III pantothenate kinase [Anaplasma bovis]|uniref:type III pantothenate kinase n=1 Tax=Anaplasma bovis TaxID=186733 RepID=UPI002FF04644